MKLYFNYLPIKDERFSPTIFFIFSIPVAQIAQDLSLKSHGQGPPMVESVLVG